MLCEPALGRPDRPHRRRRTTARAGSAGPRCAAHSRPRSRCDSLACSIVGKSAAASGPTGGIGRASAWARAVAFGFGACAAARPSLPHRASRSPGDEGDASSAGRLQPLLHRRAHARRRDRRILRRATSCRSRCRRRASGPRPARPPCRRSRRPARARGCGPTTSLITARWTSSSVGPLARSRR